MDSARISALVKVAGEGEQLCQQRVSLVSTQRRENDPNITSCTVDPQLATGFSRRSSCRRKALPTPVAVRSILLSPLNDADVGPIFSKLPGPAGNASSSV